MADIVQLVENGTKKYLKTHAKAVDGLIDMFYPIGSIYQSIVEKDPAEFMGGTWERIKGKVMVGVDEDDSDLSVANKTGGEKSTTLTANHIPKDLKLTVGGDSAIGGTGSKAFAAGSAGYAPSGGVAGIVVSNAGGQAHNNMQPYITVYMWKRVS